MSAHEPGNFLTYEEAQSNGYDIGFTITENDPWFCIDLDGCARDGKWSTESMDIFNNFRGAAYEVSQSGSGLHIFGKCAPALLMDRRNRWDEWKEFYIKERFIAFSRNGFHPIGDAFDPEIDWTPNLKRIIPARPVHEITTVNGVDPEWSGPDDDDELLRRAMASGGAGAAFAMKVSFKQLWERDADALSRFYPVAEDDKRPDGLGFDWSKADSALLFHLAFWTGRDHTRMDRLFRRSGLMRDKWDKHKSYGPKSIADAAAMPHSVYAEKKTSTDVAIDTTHPEMLDTLGQQDFFRGCVYINTIKKIWTPRGELMDRQQFQSTYSKHLFVIGSTGTKGQQVTDDPWRAFTANRVYEFPQVRDTVWDPSREPGKITGDRVNVFMQPVVATTNEPVDMFLNHVAKLLPDETDRKILMNWMASLVQNPGVKFQWAPVIQGAPGNGKTFVSMAIENAIGDELCHRPSAQNLTEKYNGFIEKAAFITVEEIDMGHRREFMDAIKPYITNERLEVRNMNTEKRMVKNFANWLFLTNHRDAIMKTVDDRRFSMLFTAQQTAEDIVRDGMGGDYMPALWSWARDGGWAAIAGYLRNFPIDPAFDPAGECQRAPNTSTTGEALVESLGPYEQSIMEAIEEELVGFRGGMASSVKIVEVLQDRFKNVNNRRIRQVMENLGYRQSLRVSGIGLEGGKKPVIYWTGGHDYNATTLREQYMKSQGYNPPLPTPV